MNHKTIIIPDLHGISLWKDILNQENTWDKIIFLGDYLDSFNIPGMQQLENLMDIIEFKKANHDKVVLLYGNHELHYVKGMNEQYSGYQSGMAYQFQFVLDDYKHLFQIAYRQDEYLFSHAGISDEWLTHSVGGYWHVDNVVNKVNELYLYQPYHFHIQPGQSYCGDETYQGPLWIRPKSLMKANKQSDIKKKYIQIVGHTHLGQIDFRGKSTGGRYYFVDCLGEYGGEYLTINNGHLKLNVIKKHKPKHPAYE